MSLEKDKFKIEKAGDTATCVYGDEKAFFDGDIPRNQIEEVFKHTQSYIESAAKTTADLASEIMKKDKKIDNVTFELPYGVSKRSNVTIKAKRSVTFNGIGDRPDVTRSDLRIAVTDVHAKMSKTKLKELHTTMTEQLLG